MKEHKKAHWIRSWKGRLGPLQAEIMDVIFTYGRNGICVGDLFEIVYDEKKLPRSSVYTVLNRLMNRGLLERKKVEGIYHYYPLIEEKDLGRFGSFQEKGYRKARLELISRLLKQELANSPQEIGKFQEILEAERKRLGKDR